VLCGGLYKGGRSCKEDWKDLKDGEGSSIVWRGKGCVKKGEGLKGSLKAWERGESFSHSAVPEMHGGKKKLVT
jgi:hypothetical protein